MTIRVAINGFGRIGRSFIRASLANDANYEIVAVNDLVESSTNAHLLKFDSTQGKLKGTVEVDGDDLVLNGKKIKILSERDPKDLPWNEMGIDVVVESTGRFASRDQAAAHLDAGAKYVVVSAPCDKADITVVMGVNDSSFDPHSHKVLSNASCTTNCFVPMIKVLDDNFEVKTALMTTVHAMTNDQNLLDLAHKDLRRARAASINIVPASTGAARATGLVLSSMVGKLDGTALRVPVPVGSITDVTAVVERSVKKDEVCQAFKDASESKELNGILRYSDEPIVSSDIVGDPASCIFDSPLTLAQPISDKETLVKIFGWYDNEWGYSSRLVDLVILIGEKIS